MARGSDGVLTPVVVTGPRTFTLPDNARKITFGQRSSGEIIAIVGRNWVSSMNRELAVLSLAAVSIAFVHTVCGPDHYLPFVAMARAGCWSSRRTMVVTMLCGAGHVGSSVVLGCLGIVFGTVLTRLEFFQAARNNVAGWMLIGSDWRIRPGRSCGTAAIGPTRTATGRFTVRTCACPIG